MTNTKRTVKFIAGFLVFAFVSTQSGIGWALRETSPGQPGSAVGKAIGDDLGTAASAVGYKRFTNDINRLSVQDAKNENIPSGRPQVDRLKSNLAAFESLYKEIQAMQPDGILKDIAIPAWEELLQSPNPETLAEYMSRFKVLMQKLSVSGGADVMNKTITKEALSLPADGYSLVYTEHPVNAALDTVKVEPIIVADAAGMEKILVIGADDAFIGSIQNWSRVIGRNHLTITQASQNPVQFMRQVSDSEAVIILDRQSTGQTLLRAIKTVKAQNPDLPIAVFTDDFVHKTPMLRANVFVYAADPADASHAVDFNRTMSQLATKVKEYKEEKAAEEAKGTGKPMELGPAIELLKGALGNSTTLKGIDFSPTLTRYENALRPGSFAVPVEILQSNPSLVDQYVRDVCMDMTNYSRGSMVMVSDEKDGIITVSVVNHPPAAAKPAALTAASAAGLRVLLVGTDRSSTVYNFVLRRVGNVNNITLIPADPGEISQTIRNGRNAGRKYDAVIIVSTDISDDSVWLDLVKKIGYATTSAPVPIAIFGKGTGRSRWLAEQNGLIFAVDPATDTTPATDFNAALGRLITTAEAAKAKGTGEATVASANGLATISEWKTIFSNKAASHAYLSHYFGEGPEWESIREERRLALLEQLNYFAETLGTNSAQVTLIRAPGRAMFIGAHTDRPLAEGPTNRFALLGYDITVAGVPREDDVVVISSEAHSELSRQLNLLDIYIDYPPMNITDPSQLGRSNEWDRVAKMIEQNVQPKSPATFVTGFAYLLNYYLRTKNNLQNNPIMVGFDCSIAGNIPIGGGISSSSATAIAMARMLMESNDIKIVDEVKDPLHEITLAEFKDIVGYSEWIAGTRGGTGDHGVIIYGDMSGIVNMAPDGTAEVLYLPSGIYQYVVKTPSRAFDRSEGKDTPDVAVASDAKTRNRVMTYGLGFYLLRSLGPQVDERFGKINRLEDIITMGIPFEKVLEAFKLLPDKLTTSDITTYIKEGALSRERDERVNEWLNDGAAWKVEDGICYVRRVTLSMVADLYRATVAFPELLKSDIPDQEKVVALRDLAEASQASQRVVDYADGTPATWNRPEITNAMIDEAISGIKEGTVNPLTGKIWTFADLRGIESYGVSSEYMDRLQDYVKAGLGEDSLKFFGFMQGAGFGGSMLFFVDPSITDKVRKLYDEFAAQNNFPEASFDMLPAGRGAESYAAPSADLLTQAKASATGDLERVKAGIRQYLQAEPGARVFSIARLAELAHLQAGTVTSVAIEQLGYAQNSKNTVKFEPDIAIFTAGKALTAAGLEYKPAAQGKSVILDCTAPESAAAVLKAMAVNGEAPLAVIVATDSEAEKLRSKVKIVSSIENASLEVAANTIADGFRADGIEDVALYTMQTNLPQSLTGKMRVVVIQEQDIYKSLQEIIAQLNITAQNPANLEQGLRLLAETIEQCL